MKTINPAWLVYRRALIDEIIGLRDEVLIVGTDRDSPAFDGDDDATSFHYGAFDGKTVYCCLSMMRADVGGQPAYQLRGMATRSGFHGVGIGKRLLLFAEEDVYRATRIGYLWCNARLGYEGFYQKQGWQVISEPFMIEGVCMHVRMEKHLEASP